MKGRPSRLSCRIAPATFAAVALFLLVPLLGGCTKYGASLSRPEEPVVLSGSVLPRLTGADPMRVVGFAWNGDAWHQVPVQVDQRDMVHPGVIRHQPESAWHDYPDGRRFEILAYTAPTSPSPGYRWWDTFTPPDRNPNLDGDDEVAFLADDTGTEAPSEAGHPGAVVASTRQTVTVEDPLASGQVGYLYLYRSTTLTGGGAGTTGVNYTFSLDSGDYRSTYRMGNNAIPPNDRSGTNPEHSTVAAPGYGLTYGDRWLNDGLSLVTDGAAGPSGLERAMLRTSADNCGRSEDTFDAGGGAFIANISGPVRGIRSVIGSNSGYYNALTDYFYPQRHDSVANLRLHNGAGAISFDDIRTGVQGLTYRDSNGSVAAIDGQPDAVSTAPTSWQMVSGDQGSLVTARALDTDVPDYEVTSYYKDQAPAVPAPCTGDANAWGQNGARVTGPGGGPLPCTDPTRYPNNTNCLAVPGRDEAYYATGTRYRYVAGPNLAPADAATLASHAQRPLQAAVT